MARQEVAHRGTLVALTSAFLFGASTPLAKLLLGGADPLLPEPASQSWHG